MAPRETASSVARDAELEELRAAARYAGAATEQEAGWFGRVLQERLARKSREHPDWNVIYGGLSTDQRSERRIAGACRRAALGGGLSSTTAHVIVAATALTEGLTASVGVPSALAALAVEPIYSAVVQVDLTCDLASIYGVPFRVGDAGELATVFDIALRGPDHDTAARPSDAKRILAPNDAEILVRVGHQLATRALFGFVPLAGIPLVASASYLKTRKLGYSAREYVRDRQTVKEILGAKLRNPLVDGTLLLQGAWLFATSDAVLTHEEAVLLATLARAIPEERRPPLGRFHLLGEGAWVMQMALLDEARCGATLDALEALGLQCSRSTPAARRFLARTAEALGRGTAH